jgi:hypothetical protein
MAKKNIQYIKRAITPDKNLTSDSVPDEALAPMNMLRPIRKLREGKKLQDMTPEERKMFQRLKDVRQKERDAAFYAGDRKITKRKEAIAKGTASFGDKVKDKISDMTGGNITFKKGGSVTRGDGIAKKGKTKGRMV